jgi:hypothetical protein
LPFLGVIAPTAFLDSRPGSLEALTANQEKLVTPFHLRRFLLEVLGYAPEEIPEWESSVSLMTPFLAPNDCEGGRVSEEMCIVGEGAQITQCVLSKWTPGRAKAEKNKKLASQHCLPDVSIWGCFRVWLICLLLAFDASGLALAVWLPIPESSIYAGIFGAKGRTAAQAKVTSGDKQAVS